MDSKAEETGTRACWFVGASYLSTGDQTARFIKDGVWENGYKDKYLDNVRSIQPGDRIAIKSTYTRKQGLPFDNRGQTVSVMAIKATGIVTENLDDGRTVKVDWTPFETPREWYFYTYRGTVWRVLPGEWAPDALIGFAFNDAPQDFDRFRNAPFWRERFGDVAETSQFHWTRFYEPFADKLLNFQNKRAELVAFIHDIAGNDEVPLSVLQDKYADGTTGPLKDICPFTTFGIFNRGITDGNRKIIAGKLAEFLGVDEAIPESFEGIPVLNNQRSWYFSYEYERKDDDIDVLWRVFAAAIRFADSDDAEARNTFIDSYDEAIERRFVAWNLSTGLYWIRPWVFPTLDSQSRSYITKKLGMKIKPAGPQKPISGTDYLALMESLEARFEEEAYPVHSFPELSLAACEYDDKEPSAEPVIAEPVDPGADVERPAKLFKPYTIDNIIDDGCFIERSELEELLDRLRTKKNLILQGSPGTGKTWLARRLAFALMGQRDESRVRAVQFHPNLSYEDFVRGWRPAGEGKLALVEGPFMEMVEAALREPSARFVIVIEEINRGNPAQIFGEMLTLLEADKRTPSEALELCYRREEGERVFIPGNLYVIGTMNIADRSLALVDLALRRRFAFVELEPRLEKAWHDWVCNKCGIGSDILDEIRRRILSLNEVIAADSTLGPQFRIGHSYVTPPFGIPIIDAREWFKQIVKTEIGPQLNEYWFDERGKADKEQARLIEGF